MKKIFLALLISLLLVNSSSLHAAVSPDIERAESLPYRPGEILVKFKPSVAETQKNKVKALLGPTFLLKKIKAKKDPSLEIELLKLEADVSPVQAAKKLQNQGDVEFASPNYIRKAFYLPNDSYFSLQWGLHNTGQTIKGVTGTVDADIDAPEAWDKEKGLTTEINVAVLDTGLDFGHSEFASKVWVNSGEIAGNDLDDDGNGYIDDVNGYNWTGISQTNIDAIWSFGRNTSPKYYAQSIKGTGQKLSHVGIYLDKASNPSEPIVVSIRTTLTGSDLSSYTISPGEISGPTYIYKALSSVLTLTSGATYYIVMRTANNSASKYYKLYGSYFDGLEDYAGGMVHSSSNGLSWSDTTEGDFLFVTNPNPYSLDDNGHGTHVSGIAAAKTDNSSGVAGVSFGAKIMPLKILDAAGYGSDSDIADAIIYAADKGAKEISMSLGGTSSDPGLESAVNYAYSQGVTLLAAVGNDGDSTINYPAGYSNVIGVAATNNQDSRASFSNYNSTVDVSAPGVNVYSTMPTYPVSLTGFGYNYSQNYDYLSGTSMATPNAAGVAALILSRNPTFSPSKVESELETTADDKGSVGWDNQYGWGRVNAASAVTNVAISVTSDGIVNFGSVGLGETTVTSSSEKEIVRVDTGPANLLIKTTLFSDGSHSWLLGSSSGEDQVKWDFSPNSISWTTFLEADVAYSLASGISSSNLQDVFFQLAMPVNTSYVSQHSSQVTVMAVAP